jgi:hypothetical protein
MFDLASFYPNDGNVDPPQEVALAMSMLYVVSGCGSLWHYNYYTQFLSRFNPPEPAAPSLVEQRLTNMTLTTQFLRAQLPYLAGQPDTLQVSAQHSIDLVPSLRPSLFSTRTSSTCFHRLCFIACSS